MRWTVEVQCSGDRRVGWTCFAGIREGNRIVSEHEIRLAADDLAHLAPSATDPTELVERSLAFLLEREPPTSILRRFDLTVINQFFPEYEATIRANARRT